MIAAGTFIVIDKCMEQMDCNAEVDVKATLKKLREQRCHSVQTDVRSSDHRSNQLIYQINQINHQSNQLQIQYIFIHKALIDYAILRHGCPKETAERFNKEVIDRLI